MSDYIKREDAIKAMEQRYEHILCAFKRKVKLGEKAIALDMVGCVKNVPPAEVVPKDSDEASVAYAEGFANGEEAERSRRKRGEWIVYNKEKPQKVGSYLVTHTTDNGSNYVDYDYWTVLDKFKYHPTDVVAWMPFPEPYEAEQTEPQTDGYISGEDFMKIFDEPQTERSER